MIYGYARQEGDRWILGFSMEAPVFEEKPATHKLVIAGNTREPVIAASVCSASDPSGFLFYPHQFGQAEEMFLAWNANSQRVCNHCYEAWSISTKKTSIKDYWQEMEPSLHGHPIYIIVYLRAEIL